MAGERACPKCGKMNDDNWPLEVGAEIKWGGCQICWEAECDGKWWKMVRAICGGAE